jgi:hypothetical protein
MTVRKAMIAVAAVASLSLLSPSDASARGGFGGGGGFHGGGGFRGGGGWRGGGYGWRGAGIGLGLGLGLAGAYGAYGYPYGYGYGYPASYAYYGGGDCYVVRRRVWTDYGWRIRPARVCNY